jgi:hypothetical protein
MMRADLANMVLGVNLLDALGIELGFDLGSVVREVGGGPHTQQGRGKCQAGTGARAHSRCE